MSMVFSNDSILCKKTSVKMPEYVQISTIMDALKKEKASLHKRYTYLTCEMISLGYNKKPPSSLKEEFDRIATRLISIEKEIESMLMSYTPTKTVSERVDDIITNAYDELDSSVSGYRPVNVAQIHQKVQTDIKKLHNDMIDFPMDGMFMQKGVYTLNTLSKVANPVDTKVAAPAKTKATAKAQVKAPAKAKPAALVPPLTRKEEKLIQKNIQQLLKEKLAFTSISECTSKARSKPFFKSKDDIIKLIEADERLKKLMPSNYKSLSKEKLCDYIFQ
jgi:hypothetical protein